LTGLGSLNRREFERYDRQMRIRGWGYEGQVKLKSAAVLVAGAGGLGCPAAIYLAAAGVGRIRVIDKERVELNNLNRQILYWESDVGRYKAESTNEKLRRLNSDVAIEVVKARIRTQNARELIQGFDVVLDGMDNFETRFVLNRACVSKEVPFIHGSVYGLEGCMTTILPRKSPCLMCIYGEVPPEIEKFPVAGPAAGMIACLQVTEALKLILGMGTPYSGRLLFWDGADMSFHEIEVDKKPDCPVCSEESETEA